LKTRRTEKELRFNRGDITVTTFSQVLRTKYSKYLSPTNEISMASCLEKMATSSDPAALVWQWVQEKRFNLTTFRFMVMMLEPSHRDELTTLHRDWQAGKLDGTNNGM
jgi:hypothetical protein